MLIMFKWFWTGNNRTQNLVCAQTPWRSNKNQKRCITSAEGFATMHTPAYRTELNFLRDKQGLSVVLHYTIRLAVWKPGE